MYTDDKYIFINQIQYFSYYSFEDKVENDRRYPLILIYYETLTV